MSWCCRVIVVLLFIQPTALLFSQTFQNQEAIKIKIGIFKNKVEYDSAIYYGINLESLTDQTGAKRENALAKIDLADTYILKRDYEQAFNKLSEAGKIINLGFLNDTELEAEYYQVKGSYWIANLDLDSAKFFLNKSIVLRSDKNGTEDTLLHYAYNKMGNLFLILSDFDSAYIYHEKALSLALKKKNKINFLAASSYQNLAIASHFRGDFNQAEVYYKYSFRLKEKLFDENDPALAKIYWNLGKFYADLYKYDSALIYYDKSEQLLSSRFSRDDEQFAHVYWNKGNVYTLKGDYSKATAYLTKAYSILEHNYGLESQAVLKILLDLGFAYSKTGDTKLSIEYYHLAAKNKDYAGIVKIYRNLGNIYQGMMKADSADKYYKLSIDYAKHFFSGNSFDLALCYKYYGEFLAENRHIEESFKYFLLSKDILTELFGAHNKDLANVLSLEGNYYLKKGEITKSLDKIQSALIALLPAFDNKDPLINPTLNEFEPDLYLPNILNLKSKAFEKKFGLDKNLNDLTKSLETIHFTLRIIEEIRKSYLEEESQLLLNKEARNVIDLGIEVAQMLYKETGDSKYLDEAFQFSEKGKSIVLLSTLRGLQAQTSINIPKIALDYEENLARELAMYGNMLYQEKQKKNPDATKINFWSDKMFNLKLSQDSLMMSFEKLYPDYFRLKYDYSIVTADSVRKLLPPDQALLEYYLTDSLIIGYLITNKSIMGRICGNKDSLLANLKGLRKYFISQDFFNSGQKEFDSIVLFSSSLYDTLIRPFSHEIEGKRLIIIPDGELGYLSFDLLLNKDSIGQTRYYYELPWLIKTNPISYSSSATIYFEQTLTKPEKSLSNLLAFAPSYDFNSTIRNGKSIDSLMLKLSPITGTREEINSISGYFRTKKRFGDEATEDYFKRHAGDYGILHLAMHTIIDNQNPLYSKLVFSPPQSGSEEDGFLNTYELFRLKLPGDLVVLSACNTGSGKLEKGEGIISLARGFFYAGIKSVVMTLWEIEDHSSADLMALFYQYLKNGDPHDIALQKAKIKYMEKAGKLQSHPYFWAGYVSLGNTNPISHSPSQKRFYSIIGIFIFLIMTILIYFFINRRVFFRKK